MRIAHENVYFLKRQDGTPVGISFGAGYSAEHEFGIKDLLSYLGVAEKEFPIGYEDRLINLNDTAKNHLVFESGVSPNHKLVDGKRKQRSIPYAFMAFLEDPEYYLKTTRIQKKVSSWTYSQVSDQFVDSIDDTFDAQELKMSDQFISSEWDSREFAITVYGKARVAALKALHAAILNGTACIFVGGSSNPFGRGGLTILDTALLPEDLKQQTIQDDTNRQQLELQVRQTGVKDALVKAKLMYPSENILGRVWTADGSFADGRTPKKGELFLFIGLNTTPRCMGWFKPEDVFEFLNNKSGPIQNELDRKQKKLTCN